MQNMIENLINGNLKDAKKQATKLRKDEIVAFLMNSGWTQTKSELAALYLKTGEGFQAYCDAV